MLALVGAMYYKDMDNFTQNFRNFFRRGQESLREQSRDEKRRDASAAMRYDYWRNLTDEARDEYMREQEDKHTSALGQNDRELRKKLEDLEDRRKKLSQQKDSGLDSDAFYKQIDDYRKLLKENDAALESRAIDDKTYKRVRDKIFQDSKNAEDKFKAYSEASDGLENLERERSSLFEDYRNKQDSINKEYQDFIDYYGIDLGDNVYKKRIESGESGRNFIREGIDKFLDPFARAFGGGSSKKEGKETPSGESTEVAEDDSDTVTFTLPRANDPEYGGFAQKIIDLGLATDKGLWGDDGDVEFYTKQLYEQGALDENGNLKIGVPIKLKRRK